MTCCRCGLAQTQGFFQQERLDAELIQMRAGITVTALATGDIQYGAPTDSIVRSAARGQPLKGMLSFVNKPMHYLVAKANFNSVEELRGKTLAINSFGASEQLTLWALLKAHGIDPDKKDVKVVAIGDSPVRLEALKRGIVDATVVLIPHVIIARNSGFKFSGSRQPSGVVHSRYRGDGSIFERKTRSSQAHGARPGESHPLHAQESRGIGARSDELARPRSRCGENPTTWHSIRSARMAVRP